METNKPDRIVEWIPYNHLQNIKYLTRGGYSEIYTAGWTDGRYFEWNTKKRQLVREYEFDESSAQSVVLNG